jgi:hypothetical protein
MGLVPNAATYAVPCSRNLFGNLCCRYAEATQIVTKAVLDMSGLE